MMQTLEEAGTPYAETYPGTGRFTGRLTGAEDRERDPARHSYVGHMTEDEFDDEIDRQIRFFFGPDA